MSRYSKRKNLVETYRGRMLPSEEQISGIKDQFIGQLSAGLKAEVQANGKHCLMLPSFVTQLPDGTEQGDVYAIDIGGTNFRVMYVKLSQDKSQVLEQDMEVVSIPKEVYTGKGEQLFDFLAASVKSFIEQHGGCSNLKSGQLPVVGFCFSFPLKQTALDKGVLLDWTKDFTCSGVIGEDPVRLLSDALKRAGRPCKVAALLNDTVGVLAAQRYLDPDTSIGIIIGTGTNACYVERIERVTKWKPPKSLKQDSETCINIEWGAFDSELLPRVEEDYAVDQATVHAGKYMFEKLLSGMYLGEVARRVLLSLTIDPDAALFSPSAASASSPIYIPPRLMEKGGFTTAHLAAIVDDRSAWLTATDGALRDALGLPTTFTVRKMVRDVCLIVAQRSAQLVACGIDSVLTHMEWRAQPRPVTIAIDGGVYDKFLTYRDLLHQALRQQLGEELYKQVKVTLVKDGSCFGAAVLAAAASR